MIKPSDAKMWVSQHKLLFYGLSFASFWAAIYLQPYIQKFLSDKVSSGLINPATIFVMWVLASYLLPIILALLVVYFMMRNNNSR